MHVRLDSFVLTAVYPVSESLFIVLLASCPA